MLTSILFLVTITTYIPFKLNFVVTFNFLSDIIIISIGQTNSMPFYGFFCLNTVKHTFRGVLNICYSNNIKTWINNCAC